MGFKIIKAEIRLASMITWFAGIQRKITDFVVGGKTRTKLEAVAVEMEAQDFQIYRAIKKAIAVAIYQAFNFNLRPAVRASGLVTITADPAPGQDIIIPKGTQLATIGTGTTAEKVYATTAAATIPAGETSVSVSVACVTAGTTGNTGPNTVKVSKATIAGVTAITNPAGFNNGTEVETEQARQVRFTQYISTLTRGIDDAIEYGAKTTYLTDEAGTITEQVTAALIVGPPAEGAAGAFTCYIYNGSGGASADLVTKTQQTIDGYRDANNKKVPGFKAAGVVATVTAATTLALDVTASVVAAFGSDKDALKIQVENAVSAYIQSLGLGAEFIYNEMIERIMSIAGVVDVTVTTPTENSTPLASQVIIPGDIVVAVP